MAVYAIRCGESGPVKLGKADDPQRRLADLQTAHWEVLSIIRTWPGGEEEEKFLHAHFASLRIRGEWFTYDPEMLVIEPNLPPRAQINVTATILSPQQVEDLARENGKTMAEVCAEAGIAVSTFWRWKTGRNSPALDVYLALVRAAGTPRIVESAA